MQLALRAAVGGVAAEDLLASRAEIDAAVAAALATAGEAYGLAVDSAGVRDLAFPGELRRVFAETATARQEARAALERARGETAALRALANAARAAEAQPAPPRRSPRCCGCGRCRRSSRRPARRSSSTARERAADQGRHAGGGSVAGVTERSMRERMLAGELYRADAEVARDHLRAVTLTEAFNATPARDEPARRRILTELLGSFGEGTTIRAPFSCDYGYQTHVGSGTFANFGLVILDVARVTIGDDVQIGPYVQLLTATHPLDPGPRREGWESAQPITIGDNVWLGGGVIVCPGVTIGEGTVVGAGSVVTRDLPPYVLAVGSPARVVRPLDGRPGHAP